MLPLLIELRASVRFCGLALEMPFAHVIRPARAYESGTWKRQFSTRIVGDMKCYPIDCAQMDFRVKRIPSRHATLPS
jgi:hypothetical protein